MKLILSTLILIPFVSFAQSPKLEWKKVQIPYRYNLYKDIKDHKKCPSPNKVIEEVFSRNKLNSAADLKMADWIELPSCNGVETLYQMPPTEEPIKENSEEIKEWNEYITPKGYVLSKDLSENQKCAKIWTKQIYEFQKKNPKVENPNNIPMNKKIFVQRCYEILKAQAVSEEKVEEKKEEIKIEPTSAEVKKEPVKIPTKEEEKVDQVVKEAINDYLINEGRFELYLGASHFNNQPIHAVGLGVRGNIVNDKGYELKMFNFGSSLIFMGELELKEHNSYKFQKTLTVGMAEYFQNEGYPAVSGNTVYVTIGMIARPTPRWVAELEVGAGLSGSLSPMIQTNAMKKFNSFWIGLFLEGRSLNNPLYKDRDNLIMSGLKISF